MSERRVSAMATRIFAKVTKKLASALAVQEFGTAKGLKKSDSFPDRCEMRLGHLIIEIRPSYSEPRLVELGLRMGAGGEITRFYNPDTLKPDYDAAERESQRMKDERLKSWVDNYGPERCKSEIDRIWMR